jgi:hypothetical protein
VCVGETLTAPLARRAAGWRALCPPQR